MTQSITTFRSLMKLGVKMLIGRLKYFLKIPERFQGAFTSLEDAVAAVPPNIPVGCNNECVTEVFFEKMCEIAPWDYPVLFWLERHLPTVRRILDAGGHMGTKYRAFRHHLNLDSRQLEWIIYDVPAIIRAGRKRACDDGLTALTFVDVDELSGIADPDLMLASGLLQYLDIPFAELLGKLPKLPLHIILNKVAMWEAQNMFTLENLGSTLVPYQIRNRNMFLGEIKNLGYRIADEWTIPSLSHVISSHPEMGRSESAGFYLALEH